MKQVYFFGAGACVGAGYPPTQSLLDEIDKEVHGVKSDIQEVWNRFNKIRHSTKGPLKLVLESPNPELVLTVPDILDSALNEGDLNALNNITKYMKSTDQKYIEEMNKWWNHPQRDELTAGRLAKLDFQRLVDHFFSMKHAGDDQTGSEKKRRYIYNAIKKLKDGDIVITTNWDTVAERTLMEQGKWLPNDGYGFRVDIEKGPTSGTSRPLPDDLKKPSQVKVLKLHGSWVGSAVTIIMTFIFAMPITCNFSVHTVI